MPVRGKAKGSQGELGGPSSPPASSTKRTTSGTTSAGQPWTEDQSRKFLAALHRYGLAWDKVAKAVGGGRTAKSCEALHKQHQGYLNLPKHLHNDLVWVTTVADHDVSRKDDDDEKTTSGGGVGNGSILSGGATTPTAKGRRTPRTGIKAAPRTPVSASSSRKAGRSSSGKAQTWGTRGIRNGTPAESGSTGKRKRAQRQMWEEEDFRARPSSRRKAARDEHADELGADALLSLAALVNDMEDDLVAGERLDDEDEEEEEEDDEELAQQALNLSELATPQGTPVKGARSTPRTSAAARRKSSSAQYGTPPSRTRPRRASQQRDRSQDEFWGRNDDDDEAMGSQDRSYGAGYSEGQQDGRRRSRRKPVPEKLPPMLSPIKSLFSGRRLGHALAGLSSLTSSLLHQSPVRTGLDGEPLPALRPAELKLRHALDARPRRWAMAEFLCSAIDRPWFMQNELQDFMAHLCLGTVKKLTRVEWAAVRAALGKPRRLSLAFLQSQRIQLEAYRQRVRNNYEEVGYGNETPDDIPKPLTVGQRVTARHPTTRQIHDGDILTVAPNCYRVMFDRRELGVELVKDIDVMPIDPVESLPASLLAAHPSLLLNGRRAVQGVPVRRQRGWGWEENGPARGPAAGRAQQEARSAAIAALESDVKVLTEVAGALDKKEALLVQLRTMNNEAEAGRQQGITHSEDFQRGYAQVVLQLKDINQLLNRHLQRLQQHASSASEYLAATGLHDAINPARAGPAITTASLAVPGGNSGVTPTQAVHHAALAVDAAAAGTAAWSAVWPQAQRMVAEKRSEFPPRPAPPPATAAAVPTSEGTAKGLENRKEADRLDNIVAGCVSLLMVVKSCAQNEVPSAVVGPALDAALASLHPHSHSNCAIFWEIKESVGLLKRQLTPAGVV